MHIGILTCPFILLPYVVKYPLNSLEIFLEQFCHPLSNELDHCALLSFFSLSFPEKNKKNASPSHSSLFHPSCFLKTTKKEVSVKENPGDTEGCLLQPPLRVSDVYWPSLYSLAQYFTYQLWLIWRLHISVLNRFALNKIESIEKSSLYCSINIAVYCKTMILLYLV